MTVALGFVLIFFTWWLAWMLAAKWWRNPPAWSIIPILLLGSSGSIVAIILAS